MEAILSALITCLSAIVLYQVPIKTYASMTRKTLALQRDDHEAENQFQIKHLLFATAVFAVLIAAAKLIVENTGFSGMSVPWWAVILSFSTFVLVAAAMLVPAIIIVFDDKRRKAAVGFAAATIFVVGPLIALIGLSIILQGRGRISAPGEFLDEIYPGTVAFTLGNLLSSMILLWLLKSFGFRLTRSGRRM